MDFHHRSNANQLCSYSLHLQFRDDELDHKDIAYESGATKKGLYSVLDKIIKTSSKVAIAISEKI